ncbi:MazG nucleotide pyrophosphohydrolase domain protein [Pseudobythopirellula maris]|uniref:MazG nucleotide pyrophosphohydrolase domain protein n=1 Tax=Pseudobythopirellula maris TaxID=2527991 RepID=A0A5C5ZRX1_9BACT|nr:nucleoside triphosphate pyrophosphohydrolase family protein [Pseudobythopirellula maris]TWT90254.1 MazG nucleotide pyrophosphohydrolase domain protein [Pseudobythopirellula maris]
MTSDVHAAGDNLTLRDYQLLAEKTDQVPEAGGGDTTSLMVPLLGLAGEAGSLLSEFKKWMRQGDIYRPFTDQVSEELGDILWYLSNIASKMNLDLDEIARENLAKLADRWGEAEKPQQSLFSTHYDQQFPEDEQLPRNFRADFRMVQASGRKKLSLTINGESSGDYLTDNAHADDGYRFHDCFHLAMAALLGWSPLVRHICRRKRKSVPDIDEVEDGARARITEEAISVLVYEFARDFSMFDGAESVEFDLLRTIKMMTRPYEVHDRTPKEWESVILKSYAVWRALIRNDGGCVTASADDELFEFSPIG